SHWYATQGFEVISMTQHPEAYLARELGLCYSGLALITDHDAGTEGLHGVPAVTQEQVFAMFDANLVLVRQILLTALEATPLERTCSCADATGGKVPTPPGAK
ncbi:MAG: 5-methylthioadenosine phosphorylase, partial [Actinomycetota bacterium]|nr:5-methylthioadenosine phosphorylase [Actinomycetota bacterium]